jgi:hypothetical protein
VSARAAAWLAWTLCAALSAFSVLAPQRRECRSVTISAVRERRDVVRHSRCVSRFLVSGEPCRMAPDGHRPQRDPGQLRCEVRPVRAAGATQCVSCPPLSSDH